MAKTMKKDDPTIDEIRAIRHKLSQKLQNDPEKIVEYYLEWQKKYRDRLVSFSHTPERLSKQ